jgi:hypothetical protein
VHVAPGGGVIKALIAENICPARRNYQRANGRRRLLSILAGGRPAGALHILI